MPLYVWALIITSHALLLIAAVAAFVVLVAEYQERHEERAAKALNEAVRRHPAGKGRVR